MDFDNIKKKAEEVFDIAAEPTVDIVSSMVFEGVIGSIAPGVVSAVLAYKQKRQERNYEKFLILLKERCSELEARLEKLEEESRKTFTSDYFGIISDYVLDEVQEEKIDYIVNGFVNLALIQSAKEDFVLSYYDTLRELRMVDIAILRTYKYAEDSARIRKSYGIDLNQHRLIEQKLVRLGLLDFKSGAPIESMLGIIKERTVDQYWLNEYGNEFLKFFIEKY